MNDERNHRELIEWLDEIERSLWGLRLVLFASSFCTFGLLVILIVEMK